jgi:NADH dehydrogenase
MASRIGQIIGKKRPIISIPPSLGYSIGWIVGKLVDDVLITRAEIDGLMADLLYVQSEPLGSVRLTAWAQQHAAHLGRHYASELGRRKYPLQAV